MVDLLDVLFRCYTLSGDQVVTLTGVDFAMGLIEQDTSSWVVTSSDTKFLGADQVEVTSHIEDESNSGATFNMVSVWKRQSDETQFPSVWKLIMRILPELS